MLGILGLLVLLLSSIALRPGGRVIGRRSLSYLRSGKSGPRSVQLGRLGDVGSLGGLVGLLDAQGFDNRLEIFHDRLELGIVIKLARVSGGTSRVVQRAEFERWISWPSW